MAQQTWSDPLGLVTVLTAVAEGAARAAGSALWPCGTGELTHSLSIVARARHELAVIERRLVAEAIERGLPAELGDTPVDWVVRRESAQAPAPSVFHAAAVVRLAQAQGRHEDTEVLGRVDEGLLAPELADHLVRFRAEAAPVADPGELSSLMEVLTDAASDHLPSGGAPRVSGMTLRELQRTLSRARRLLKPAADLDRDDERWASSRALYVSPGAAGMSCYRLILDPEGAAVLNAALAALSGPVPHEDGTRDERTPAARRADALLALVRRAVSTADQGMPSASGAQLVVTLAWDHLRDGVCGAGLTGTDEVLSPAVVRRLACDGDIIPMVLGSDSELLDVGRAKRLFTAGQRRALVQRDGGCSFPGCTAPPGWCQAHHVVHWIHGGPTDLSNGALLCQRHHAYVHRRDLTASVTDSGVFWHV